MKKCVKCGYKLEDDALFCAACGTKQSVPQDSGVQTEDIRDMVTESAGQPDANALPTHDPHDNPYVAARHETHKEQNTAARREARKAVNAAAGHDPHRNPYVAGYDPGPLPGAPAKKKGKKEAAPEPRQGKRRHPALSVFLLILFFLFFNIGLVSLCVHRMVSTEHVEEAVLEADISEIELGGFVERIYDAYDEKLSDEEYDKMVDATEKLFGKVDEYSTFAELFRRRDLEIDIGGNPRKSGDKAIDSLGFKEKLADLVTRYTSDIFFDSGKGKLDTDDITDLVYAFYSTYYKEELKSARDSGKISEYIYESYLEQYSGERLRRVVSSSLQNDPKFNDDTFKELSVKKLFKDQPLWIVRVLASVVFGAGMVVLGIIFLVLSYLVNRRGIKRGLIRMGILLAIEMFLIGFFLIGMKIAESAVTSASAKAVAEVMIDMMSQ